MLQKILCLLLVFLAFGCSRSEADIARLKKPTILVSIAPYRFLADRITGSEYNIYTVVPDNANPHVFEPTSSQVLEISEGLVWFQIGEAFENKILPILRSKNPELLVKDLRDGIELIEECGCCSKESGDRHIWLSPNLAILQAKLIKETLCERFPEHQTMFESNFEKLSEELISLDEEIHETLKDIRTRSILVSHPAFGYYCKEYDLTQLSVEFEGKEPRPKHLEKILKKAAEDHMELALALPQHNNKGVQLIAKELDASVHMIDPYSADYFNTMRKLTAYIKEPYVDQH